MRQWAASHAPGVDVDTQTANFVDYWAAKPGKDARKVDWVRTWYRWLRREQERAPARPRTAAVPSPGADLVEWLRGLWQTADLAPIEKAAGLRYERPDLPVGIDGKQAVADFFRDHRRAWIDTHRAEILSQLAHKDAA